MDKPACSSGCGGSSAAYCFKSGQRNHKDLVSNAWGVFGAAFGPVILLSLFWSRLTFSGAVAGIVVGALADILWLAFLSSTGIYEIVPGFLLGLAAAVFVSLLSKAPGVEVGRMFDRMASDEEI